MKCQIGGTAKLQSVMQLQTVRSWETQRKNILNFKTDYKVIYNEQRNKRFSFT